MDVFYEESAVNSNAEKGMKLYKVFHVISWIFFLLCFVCSVWALMSIPACNYTDKAQYLIDIFESLFVLGIAIFFLFLWFLFYQLKRRVNISYDYIFVSGELRIAKIFNINKRKFLEKIDCEDIVQIGDTENPSFERFATAPDTKVVYYTQNMEAAEGKFFMYILVNSNGKRLLVLEARELLLMNILKFTRRGVLESDYVMQEKKQK